MRAERMGVSAPQGRGNRTSGFLFALANHVLAKRPNLIGECKSICYPRFIGQMFAGPDLSAEARRIVRILIS